MGQVSSRVLCTEVGIREGDKNLQKTHRIQETVAGIHSVHGSKAILYTCRGTKVFHLVSCPTCSLRPAPSHIFSPAPSHIFRSPACTKAASSNCHRFKLLKKSQLCKTHTPKQHAMMIPQPYHSRPREWQNPIILWPFPGGRKKTEDKRSMRN